MENESRPDFAQRLEQARLKRGFKTAKDAARFFGWNYETYAQHENGTRGIVRAADRYARAYRVSPGWLLTGEGKAPGEEDQTNMLARRVRVKGYLQAGEWAETWELPEDEQYDVPVAVEPREPLALATLHGGELRGPSMDRKWPEGTVVIFTDMIETGEEVIVGKQYVVERERADGMREATVKTLWRDDSGKLWLLPESNDPRFQQPIPINGGENDTVRIVGRVRFAVSRL